MNASQVRSVHARVIAHDIRREVEQDAEAGQQGQNGEPRISLPPEQGSQARAALLIETLDDLARKSGLPLRLRDHGIAFEDCPLLGKEAMRQTRLLVNNPCEITESDAQRLYEAAW